MSTIESIWSWLVSACQWPFSDEGGKVLGAWASIVAIALFVAGIVTWLFKRFRAQKTKEPAKPSEALTKRNRERMLERVRHDWVKPGLENSLYHVARLELGLKETPEAIEHPWKLCVEQLSLQPVTLPNGIPMREVFHRFNDTLLLLGAPGSGKTTLLLELARDLITEAEQDNEKPVPVIFHLSSWAVQRLTIAEWLADELHRQFGVNKNTTRFLIENDHVLPLLDGLDEVAREHRDNCVEAINTFRTDHGLLPLAICSRAEEYAALAKKLHLQTAVTIQPLEFEQVDRYLAQAGAPLENIRKLITYDQTLQELLNTPLMLSIMQLAFAGTQDAAKTLATGSLEERCRNLLNTYIEEMFKRCKTSASYTPEQTKTWLSRLACSMKERDQNVFYLELMQPSLLPNRLKIMHRILSTIAAGIIVALTGGLSFGLIGALPFGLIVGLILGVLSGLFRELKTDKIELAEGNFETLRWLKSLILHNFLLKVPGLLLVGVIYGVFGGVLFGGLRGVLFGVLIAMLCGVLIEHINITIYQKMNERRVPNEGLYRSLTNALFVAIALDLGNVLVLGIW